MPTNNQVCKKSVNAFATPITNDMSKPISLLSYLESQGLTIDNIKEEAMATPNAEILIQRPREISEVSQETHRMIARVILNYMGIQCHYGEPGCSISNNLSEENNLAFDTYIFSKVIIQTDEIITIPMGFKQIGLMNLDANIHHVLRQLFSILRGMTISARNTYGLKTRYYRMFQIPPENVGYAFFLMDVIEKACHSEKLINYSKKTLTTHCKETCELYNLDDVRFAPTIIERVKSW